MEFKQFKNSLEKSKPPSELSPLLEALWYEGKGDWEKAHKIADKIGGYKGDWVHAYLHRKEGDIWNADYWYRRAGKLRPSCTLEEEWEDISKALLKKAN